MFSMMVSLSVSLQSDFFLWGQIVTSGSDGGNDDGKTLCTEILIKMDFQQIQ